MRSLAPYRSLPAADVPHHLPLQTSDRTVALLVADEICGLRLSDVGTGLYCELGALSRLRHVHVCDSRRLDTYYPAPA